MRRLPKVLTAVTLGGCSAPMAQGDAGLDGGYDAGARDAGATPDAGRDAGRGTPWGDAGCVLPTDFPWDAGAFVADIADSACLCTDVPLMHCFEENGPRCFSWACPPEKNQADGGYTYTADGGINCLC